MGTAATEGSVKNEHIDDVSKEKYIRSFSWLRRRSISAVLAFLRDLFSERSADFWAVSRLLLAFSTTASARYKYTELVSNLSYIYKENRQIAFAFAEAHRSRPF